MLAKTVGLTTREETYRWIRYNMYIIHNVGCKQDLSPDDGADGKRTYRYRKGSDRIEHTYHTCMYAVHWISPKTVGLGTREDTCIERIGKDRIYVYYIHVSCKRDISQDGGADGKRRDRYRNDVIGYIKETL